MGGMHTPDSVMEPGPRPAGPGTPQFVEAREEAIRLLTDRYGDGTLGDAEFELRLGQLRAAADATALEAVALDLRDRPTPETGARHVGVPAPWPRPAPSYPAPSYPAPSYPAPSPALPDDEQRILAVMTETRRSGWWSVPHRLRVTAIMSEVKLDLREAAIAPGATIEVMSIMANVIILVPPGLAVEFEVSAMLGSAIGPKESPSLYSGAPRLRVVGSSTMAEVRVKVVHPVPPGTPKSRWAWLTGN